MAINRINTAGEGGAAKERVSSGSVIGLLRSMILVTLVSVPAVAAGAPRTDLPSCESAKQTAQANPNAEGWGKLMCLCERLKKNYEIIDGAQDQYEQKCAKASVTPTAPAVVQPEEPKVQKPVEPREKPKAKVKAKKKEEKPAPEPTTPAPSTVPDGGTLVPVTPENTPPTEMPKELYWALWALLGLLGVEGFLRLRSEAFKAAASTIQERNKVVAKEWEETYNPKEGIDCGSIPLYGSFKAFITNRAQYKLALKQHKEFARRLNK